MGGHFSAVIFMGSEKYPEENAMDEYASCHAGYMDASTGYEHVCLVHCTPDGSAQMILRDYWENY